uniref:Uncharacterized protein n=1 Tax=Parascaris equorum TaxID=6256 RepID=A0A914RF26_PAREQ
MATIRNLADYFKTLNTLLAAESWRMAEEAAKFFSVKGPHAHYKFLQIETAANERRPQIDSIFDDLACLHLVIVQLFNEEILQKEKDQNWFMPIFYRFCTDLRLIARA